MPVDLRSAGTNYCVPAIQRIGSTDAWRERRTAANGLRGQTRTVVERQVAVQSPAVLDKFRDLRVCCAQQACPLKVDPFGNRPILRQNLDWMGYARTVVAAL